MADVARIGAAKRQRERRLRTWWRQEAQSVQAVVVSALHHSRCVGSPQELSPTGTEEDRRGGGERLESHSGLRADAPLSGDAAGASC